MRSRPLKSPVTDSSSVFFVHVWRVAVRAVTHMRACMNVCVPVLMRAFVRKRMVEPTVSTSWGHSLRLARVPAL